MGDDTYSADPHRIVSVNEASPRDGTWENTGRHCIIVKENLHKYNTIHSKYVFSFFGLFFVFLCSD